MGIRYVTQGAQPVLCDDLKEWYGGRWEREGLYMYILYIYILESVIIYICVYVFAQYLIHVVVWQKPIQHCKAIFYQLKKIFLRVAKRSLDMF